MIDIDKVLPLVVRAGGFQLDIDICEAQRDADWERVKALVEAAQELAGYFPPIVRHQNDERSWLFPAGSMMDSRFILALREALAQLERGEKL